MNDPVTIRLYEDPTRNAARHTGPYHPAGVAGWDLGVGDDLGLEDDFGGYLLGTITRLDPAPHTDPDAGRYRIAVVVPKD